MLGVAWMGGAIARRKDQRSTRPGNRELRANLRRGPKDGMASLSRTL